MNKKWLKRRQRLFQIIDVGYDLDWVSRGYDYINVIAIVLNLAVSILHTYETIREQYEPILLVIEAVTVAFFVIDYIFRLITARCMYKEKNEWKAIRKYVFSFMGIVDLLSFLPYFLPVIFPQGTIAFRMIRIVRIFRLFRIDTYYDSLHVITDVLYQKRQQLISSVVMILILILILFFAKEHKKVKNQLYNAKIE